MIYKRTIYRFKTEEELTQEFGANFRNNNSKLLHGKFNWVSSSHTDDIYKGDNINLGHDGILGLEINLKLYKTIMASKKSTYQYCYISVPYRAIVNRHKDVGRKTSLRDIETNYYTTSGMVTKEELTENVNLGVEDKTLSNFLVELLETEVDE